MAIEEKAVLESVRKIYAEQDLETVTEKRLRRLVEEDLNYPEDSLEEANIKKVIKNELRGLMDLNIPVKVKEVNSKKLELNSPVKTPVKKATKAVPTKSKKKSVKISSDEKTEESEDKEAVPELESEAETPKREKSAKAKVIKKAGTPKKRASKRTHSDSDAEDASPEATVQKKAPKPKKIKSEIQEDEVVPSEKEVEAEDLKDSDLSSLVNSDDESKKPVAKRKTSGKRASKTPAQPNEKTLKKINHLKSYVLKCGVRKHWKSVFANLGPRQQVNKLKEILEDLGVEGRPTIEKCKIVAKKVALDKERESLDLSNIISEERRPRRACTIDYTKFGAPSKKDIEKNDEESDEVNASEESSESEEEWDKAILSEEEVPVKRKKSNIIQESDEESDAKIDSAAASPNAAALKKSDSDDAIDDINDSDNTSLPTLDSPGSKDNVSDADGELAESTNKEVELSVDFKKESSPMPVQTLDDSTLNEKSSPSIANHSQGPSEEPVKAPTPQADAEVDISKSLPSTPPKEVTPIQKDLPEESLADQMFSDSE